MIRLFSGAARGVNKIAKKMEPKISEVVINTAEKKKPEILGKNYQVTLLNSKPPVRELTKEEQEFVDAVEFSQSGEVPNTCKK